MSTRDRYTPARTATAAAAPEPGSQHHAPRVAQRPAKAGRARLLVFGAIVVAVMVGGVYLAAGDLFGQRGTATATGATAVRLSMAGFTPSEITVSAGKPVTLELWTTDAAPHLQNGVHTMISDQLGIHFELAAAGATGESRKDVQFVAPTAPGTYDIYCNSCCGGKDSPTMHGKITVVA